MYSLGHKDDGNDDNYILRVNANMDFRKEIMHHSTKFIGLLKVEHLRASLVELLSILSTNDTSSYLSSFTMDRSDVYLFFSTAKNQHEHPHLSPGQTKLRFSGSSRIARSHDFGWYVAL